MTLDPSSKAIQNQSAQRREVSYRNVRINGRSIVQIHHPITGELKTKKSRKGAKNYVYYRCASYNTPGHPRIRLTESHLDAQMLAVFDSLKIKDETGLARYYVRSVKILSEIRRSGVRS
jgi:hypothetical protein